VFEKAAVYDNECALLFSALIYYQGFDNTVQGFSKCMGYLKRAALTWDNRIAQNCLGVMYMTEEGGVVQNAKEALKWLALAADKGWTNAMKHIGAMFNNGMSENEA
jgi:TPR repeat protein